MNQLPVLEGPKVVGIVTDRDLRDAFPSVAESVGGRRQLPKGADPRTIAIEDVMAREVLTVEPDGQLVAAAELMRRERIGALPVVHGGRLLGILTRSDLLDALVRLLRAGSG